MMNIHIIDIVIIEHEIEIVDLNRKGRKEESYLAVALDTMTGFCLPGWDSSQILVSNPAAEHTEGSPSPSVPILTLTAPTFGICSNSIFKTPGSASWGMGWEG